jgi:hypothetical protein
MFALCSWRIFEIVGFAEPFGALWNGRPYVFHQQASGRRTEQTWGAPTDAFLD